MRACAHAAACARPRPGYAFLRPPPFRPLPAHKPPHPQLQQLTLPPHTRLQQLTPPPAPRGRWTQENIKAFKDGMQVCFTEALNLGLTIGVRPHLVRAHPQAAGPRPRQRPCPHPRPRPRDTPVRGTQAQHAWPSSPAQASVLRVHARRRPGPLPCAGPRRAVSPSPLCPGPRRNRMTAPARARGATACCSVPRSSTAACRTMVGGGCTRRPQSPKCMQAQNACMPVSRRAGHVHTAAGSGCPPASQCPCAKQPPTHRPRRTHHARPRHDVPQRHHACAGGRRAEGRAGADKGKARRHEACCLLCNAGAGAE